jgi:hypothetical protein
LLVPQIEMASHKIAAAQKASDDFNALLLNREGLRRALESWSEQFTETTRSRINTAEQAVRREISAGELARDSTYEASINAKLNVIASDLVVCEELDQKLARFRFEALSADARRYILACVRFSSVSVAVADTPLPKGRIVMGVLGGAILGPWGAAAGGAAAAASAMAAKKSKDVAMTQGELKAAMLGVHQEVETIADKVSKIVVRQYLGQVPKRPAEPDTAPLQNLTRIDTACQYLLTTYRPSGPQL